MTEVRIEQPVHAQTAAMTHDQNYLRGSAALPGGVEWGAAGKARAGERQERLGQVGEEAKGRGYAMHHTVVHRG